MNYKWTIKKLADIADFNPRETLSKGKIAKKVGMDKLQPFCRDISSYKMTAFSGGTKFRNGDTIMAKITPCLENGKIAKVDILDDNEIGFGSTEYIVFRAKEGVDRDFLYYLVCSSMVREPAIKSMVGSSGRQRVQTKVVQNIDIAVPPYEEQRLIGGILKDLDDKIKLNNEINKNLEEQAATLFSENYFNSNYNVYKLEDVATIKYGKELPTKKLTPKGFPVFGGNGVIGKYIHFMYDEPQILVSCRGAASGNIIETYPNSFVTNNSLVLEWNDYRYYEFYKQFLFANPLHTYATGSAQQQITIDNIKNVPFPCPKYDEIRELCSQLKSISALHFENIVESNKLSMLRDTLLPKLISGELDVSNLDI